MPTHWAIDLGTSNTTICEDRSGRPHVVNLPELAKLEPVTQTPVMPSCVCVMDEQGEKVLIGQEAVTYNWDGRATGFARGFKRHLGMERGRTMARVGGRAFTAYDVTSLFLREVVRTLEARFEEEVTDVTIATPSGFYETYRAELQTILRRVKRRGWWDRLWARLRGKPSGIAFRTLDEPVAAALGYGVDVGRPTTLVAFDFGGGTMESAVVRTHGARTVETGQAEVLAKQAVEIGGDDIDRWILERLVPSALHDWPEWEVALRWEAERVKLLASAGSEGDFTFRNESYGRLDYNVLSDILAENGLYARIRELLDALLTELRTRHAVLPAEIDDVILEGGSTLLPEVRNVVGDVLGREKVREWLPFEAVARGACIFAGGAHVEDFIYHDYAIRLLPDDDKGGRVRTPHPRRHPLPHGRQLRNPLLRPRLRRPAAHQPLHLRGRARGGASGRLDRAAQRIPLLRAHDGRRTRVLPVPQRGGSRAAAQSGGQGHVAPAARDLRG